MKWTVFLHIACSDQPNSVLPKHQTLQMQGMLQIGMNKGIYCFYYRHCNKGFPLMESSYAASFI